MERHQLGFHLDPESSARQLSGVETMTCDSVKLDESLVKLVEALARTPFCLASTMVGSRFVGFGIWVLSTDPVT